GFVLMFRKILAGRQPALGAVVFDPPGKTFRDETYPAYKAHRPRMPSELRQQLEWIDAVVEAFDFPTLRVKGFEADDVIGTLTAQALELGHEVHIISADKDFAQLINDRVRMIDTMRDITYDPELVRKKWGVEPASIVDLLALMGDKSDNVPGVPGIGQKGAAKLIAAYGDLDGILAHVDDLKGRQKSALTEHRDLALLSRDLVTIRQNVALDRTVEQLTIPEPDPARLNALYQELEFYSLLDEGAQTRATSAETHFSPVGSVVELQKLLDGMADAPTAFWTVNGPPSAVTGSLVGIALSGAAAHGHYVPLFGGPGALGEAAVEPLRQWLEDPDRPKLTHNTRDQMTLWLRHGVQIEGVQLDTQLASFLIDPVRIIPHRLDQVVREFLHRPIAQEKSLLGSGKAKKRLEEIPLDELTDFACQSAAAILEMSPAVEQRLAETEQRGNLASLALPMCNVLAHMQHTGIRVDTERLDALGAEFNARRAEVDQQIYEIAGHEFNIGSNKQLSTVLFEELELPILKRTKTGYSTAADVLERLAGKGHEIASHVVRRRALAKLVNTYTRVLAEAVDERTGRVHCTLQQTTGRSGRLITTDPDLQRTPIRTEDGKRIREAFVPREGWVMISADWSQIELRVLAHFSQDPQLIAAFVENVDVHRRTAAQLFDVTPEQVTPTQRNIGKTVNFATIYGQGATALGQQLGIERSDAKAYIDRYFARFSRVKEWVDATVADAYQKTYVETLLGRRRYVPELKSNNFNDRAYGERIAANTPIQGSAADLCKEAMLQIDRRMKEERLEGKMLLQIHDELLFECPPAELDVLEALVKDRMEHAIELAVPLRVDIGHGASWADAKA
ncbi:MAG TPA: DNA polymerase I, partial [Polyangiaceae bacterium]|nr:DNA polymerase I [Polyangiaceae bacterium]